MRTQRHNGDIGATKGGDCTRGRSKITPMRILALDTSTEWCSVAAGDGDLWNEECLHSREAHSEHVLPMVDRVLASCGYALSSVDAIAFGAGPGSFTGVRIAAGVAQGLALGADVRVLPVCTLEAIARVDGGERVIACLDARMREIYVGAYQRDGERYVEVAPPAVTAPERAARPRGEEWRGAGNGFAAYPGLRAQLALASVDDSAVPTARAIAAIALPRAIAGEGVGAADALPHYVRHRVALTAAERAAGATL
jgi:tRNA threonylcarbamoyladenosine biosynthesis protein TsaB